MSDPMHPSDRSWIEYHVRMGMDMQDALVALIQYREFIREMVREGEPDISDVVAGAEVSLATKNEQIAYLEHALASARGKIAELEQDAKRYRIRRREFAYQLGEPPHLYDEETDAIGRIQQRADAAIAKEQAEVKP